MKQGFSLIELVIIVGITSVLTIVITTVAMTNLLSSARIRNLVKSRQAGDTALNQMATFIRNARAITSCNSTSNVITLENLDGQSTTYSLAGTYIASNSGAITPTDHTVTGFDIDCAPSDTTPSLVTVKFNLTNAAESTRALETPVLPFAITVQIRN